MSANPSSAPSFPSLGQVTHLLSCPEKAGQPGVASHTGETFTHNICDPTSQMELYDFFLSSYYHSFKLKLNLTSVLCCRSARRVETPSGDWFPFVPQPFPSSPGFPDFCEAEVLGTVVAAGTRVWAGWFPPTGPHGVPRLSPSHCLRPGVPGLFPGHSQGLAARCLPGDPASFFSSLQFCVFGLRPGATCHRPLCPDPGALPLLLGGGASFSARRLFPDGNSPYFPWLSQL